jgi:hypothetical protein
MRGAIPPLPNTPSWRGAQLKHRDIFTFAFTFGHSRHFKMKVSVDTASLCMSPVRSHAIYMQPFFLCILFCRRTLMDIN